MGIFKRVSERDRFGQEVAARIAADKRVASAVYDPDGFKVTVRRHDGAGEGELFLGNAFRERERLDADERRVQLDRLASNVAPPPVPTGWAEVRPALRPVLRQADFGMGHDGIPEVLSRPAQPCLSEFVVIDTPEAMAYPTLRDLDQWGVSAQEVFAAAHENLAREFGKLLEERGGHAPAVTDFMGVTHTYLGSLILLEGWLATWSAGWGRRPLVFVPDQGGMLVVPEPQSPDDLIALLDREQTRWGEAVRSISPVAYTLDDTGRVMPYDVPAGHPARDVVRRGWGALASVVYSSQTERLRAAARPGDPFAAAFSRYGRPGTDATFTLATWSNDQPTLLPEAEWIAFPENGDDEQFFATWEVVAEETGLVPEPGYHPARYLVSDWPEPEAMSRLRARAATP
ncbi:hypothetical protein ABH926_004414 [Catenulispora sp. GP43]|uniref:hypothetical protein n=1 Tax=Catenulispora sp. GP43 TaxID=3156263 RepID=UPI0035159FE0